MKLLEDILVVDFSQFLSGPSAGLRLADLGARVIKIERSGVGDICRELYVSDVMLEGESTIFHGEVVLVCDHILLAKRKSGY